MESRSIRWSEIHSDEVRTKRRRMEFMAKNLIVALVFMLAVYAFASAQQDKSKRPSPPAQAQCKFSDSKTITIDYSSPRMKGRKIFGGLVPYGEVWRTGAN